MFKDSLRIRSKKRIPRGKFSDSRTEIIEGAVQEYRKKRREVGTDGGYVVNPTVSERPVKNQEAGLGLPIANMANRNVAAPGVFLVGIEKLSQTEIFIKR